MVDMNTRNYIGIDCGKNGGIAVLSSAGDVLALTKTPDTPRDLYEFLLRHSENAVCILEKVHGMPGQGGGAMFNFGRSYGHLQMALIALQIPTEEIIPQKWEKSYSLGTSKGLTKTQWKNRLKAKAQALFPALGGQVTLATCDALLIAEYGRRQRL